MAKNRETLEWIMGFMAVKLSKARDRIVLFGRGARRTGNQVSTLRLAEAVIADEQHKQIVFRTTRSKPARKIANFRKMRTGKPENFSPLISNMIDTDHFIFHDD